MKVCSYKDDLRLLLSESYKISDSDYNQLSEILISSGISEKSLFDDGMMYILIVMCENGVQFPISTQFLKDLWSDKYLNYNFVDKISNLNKSGMLNIRRSSKEVFNSSNTICKSGNEVPNGEFFSVVYADDVIKDILNSLCDILDRSEKLVQTFEGATKSIPRKIEMVIDRTNNIIKQFNVGISIEAFVRDVTSSMESLSIIVKDLYYSGTDKDIERTVKKQMIRLDYVKSVTAYKDSKTEIYIEIDMEGQDYYKNLPNVLVDAIVNLLDERLTPLKR